MIVASYVGDAPPLSAIYSFNAYLIHFEKRFFDFVHLKYLTTFLNMFSVGFFNL